jgi:hypothetical protein
MIYNTDYHTYQFCNGSSWTQVGESGFNPVGWWKFDESAGTTATDSSTSGNNGTLTNGPTWQTSGGQFSGAVQLDGTNDYVTMGDPANGSLDFGTGSFTVSVWVYPTASVGCCDMAVFKGGSSSSVAGYDMELGTGAWMASISDGTTNYTVNFCGSPPASSNWYHLALVVDRSSQYVKTYYNGAYQNQTSIASLGSLDATRSLTIGASNVPSNLFQGKIDDLRIYNRALSSTEIASLYAGSCTSPTGAERTMIYNGDYHKPQYCNGNSWVPMQ